MDNRFFGDKINLSQPYQAQYVLLLDFDQTITSTHIFALLDKIHKAEWEKFEKPEDKLEAQWKIVSHYLNHKKHSTSPLGGKDKWKNLIETWLEEDHKVGIVSFNPYVEIIRKYLIEIIELSKNTVDKIIIEAWLPDRNYSHGKNNHIQKALTAGKFTGNKDHVYLIDDDENNLKKAKAKGYQTMLAKNDGSHLDEALSLIEHLKNNKPLPFYP